MLSIYIISNETRNYVVYIRNRCIYHGFQIQILIDISMVNHGYAYGLSIMDIPGVNNGCIEYHYNIILIL